MIVFVAKRIEKSSSDLAGHLRNMCRAKVKPATAKATDDNTAWVARVAV